MADDPQTKGPNASARSVVVDFIGTVWGKVLTVLAAITMLLGIAAEGVSLYKSSWDVEIARQQATELEIKTHSMKQTPPDLVNSIFAPEPDHSK
jgi:hypothetical protein